MIAKWIGAILIIGSCGGFSYALAKHHRRDVRLLKQFINLLDFMECQLQYAMPALPDLFRLSAEESEGELQTVFTDLTDLLEGQTYPNVKLCMQTVLDNNRNLPLVLKEVMSLFADTVGRFDLAGQINRLQGVREECRYKLSTLLETREPRIRSYQTLGICCGAALIILLM